MTQNPNRGNLNMLEQRRLSCGGAARRSRFIGRSRTGCQRLAKAETGRCSQAPLSHHQSARLNLKYRQACATETMPVRSSVMPERSSALLIRSLIRPVCLFITLLRKERNQLQAGAEISGDLSPLLRPCLYRCEYLMGGMRLLVHK